MTDPIGIQNQNPTNLRPLPNGEQWDGQTGVSEGFCVFAAPTFGIRAAAKNLQSYGRDGVNTIRAIYRAWAPASDGNDPDAYANFVAAHAGYDIDAVLDLESQVILVALIQASTLVENGTPPNGDANWYPVSTFVGGVALAFPSETPEPAAFLIPGN